MTITPHPEATKTVALYSGGLDSYIMATLTHPDILLHVNLHGAYGNAETRALKTPPGMEHKLVTLDHPQLAQYEYPDRRYIIPARNAFLILLAAQYGNTIYLGSIAASRGSDKDEKFRRHINKLLAHIWSPQPYWLPDGRPTRVEYPLGKMTKAQAVAAALKHGATPDELRDNTFTCYTPNPDGSPCEKCAPCGRKWAALAANNINPGYNGRAAYKPYWREVQTGEALHTRGRQHVEDVIKAWNSIY